MTIKTKTKTGKNQKLSRKVREEANGSYQFFSANGSYQFLDNVIRVQN